MKIIHKITPVTSFVISVAGGIKVCRQAKIAARHYAVMANDVWWKVNGCKMPRPMAHQVSIARREKLYRRVLPIFQKILP